MIIPYHSFIAKTLNVIDIHAWIELNKLAFQLNVINFETLMLFLSWWFPTIALLQKDMNCDYYTCIGIKHKLNWIS